MLRSWSDNTTKKNARKWYPFWREREREEGEERFNTKYRYQRVFNEWSSRSWILFHEKTIVLIHTPTIIQYTQKHVKTKTVHTNTVIQSETVEPGLTQTYVFKGLSIWFKFIYWEQSSNRSRRREQSKYLPASQIFVLLQILTQIAILLL